MRNDLNLFPFFQSLSGLLEVTSQRDRKKTNSHSRGEEFVTCHQRNVRLCWSFLFFRAEKRRAFPEWKKGVKRSWATSKKKKHWLCAGTCFEHSRGKECINFFLSSFFFQGSPNKVVTRFNRALLTMEKKGKERLFFFI